MRTFAHHEHKHELHGITVVVEIVADGVILKDADVHREGETERPLAEWLERAKRYGVFPHHRQHLVAAPRVRNVRRLAEL